MKKFLIILFVLILIVSVVLLSYPSDKQSNSYKDLLTAKADSAIERGWIPAIVPESAYNIEETHNLDSNVFYGSFYYKEKDEATLLKHLTLIDENDKTYKWKDTLFHVDTKLDKVWYRNKGD